MTSYAHKVVTIASPTTCIAYISVVLAGIVTNIRYNAFDRSAGAATRLDSDHHAGLTPLLVSGI